MHSDNGKLFIGGISQNTNEEHLKKYFSSYGEVLGVVIKKDHNTGRNRGFGFIVFVDPDIAERVTEKKHKIDRKMVVVEKVLPRGDLSTMRTSSSNIQGSLGPRHTRKIFVGGLVSTVTESVFKRYFEQFGTITDVVVMYNHKTQRPRGFGFITYDSKDAVDRALTENPHELNGKMVEAKRAIPKDLSPGPSQNTLGAYTYASTRISSFLNGSNQESYSRNTIGVRSYDVMMDSRRSLIPFDRSGVPTFSCGNGMGLTFEPGMNRNYGGSTNHNSTMNYGMEVNPYCVGNSNRFGSPITFDRESGMTTSFFSLNPRNLWGSERINYGSNSAGVGAYVRSESGIFGTGVLGITGLSWALSPIPPQGTYGINATTISEVPTSSLVTISSADYHGPISGVYGSDGSVFRGDPTWCSTNSGRNSSSSFGGYELGSGGFDV